MDGFVLKNESNWNLIVSLYENWWEFYGKFYENVRCDELNYFLFFFGFELWSDLELFKILAN